MKLGLPKFHGALSGWQIEGKRTAFVEVTFALSVGECIWLFVLIRNKSLFLSFKRCKLFMEGGVFLAVYLSCFRFCTNLSVDFCYIYVVLISVNMWD